MQDLQINVSLILADVQEVLPVWLQAGDEGSVLKYLVFAAAGGMVRVEADLEMVLVLWRNGDGVIFHGVFFEENKNLD